MTTRHLFSSVNVCAATAAARRLRKSHSTRLCQETCGTISDTVPAEAYFIAVISAVSQYRSTCHALKHVVLYSRSSPTPRIYSYLHNKLQRSLQSHLPTINTASCTSLELNLIQNDLTVSVFLFRPITDLSDTLLCSNSFHGSKTSFRNWVPVVKIFHAWHGTRRFITLFLIRPYPKPLFEIHFNIILQSTLSVAIWFHAFRFYGWKFVCVLPYFCVTFLIHLSPRFC